MADSRDDALADAGPSASVPMSPDDSPSPALPDVRADVMAGLMARLEAFGDEWGRLARTREQKALAEAFGELVADVHR